jgi:hypothetical protein
LLLRDTKCLEPVHLRHFNVQQDKIGRVPLAKRDGLFTGFMERKIILSLQKSAHLLQTRYIVVHDQNVILQA